jgi:hypothetical protein
MKRWLVLFALISLATGCISIPPKASADGGVNCIFPEPGGTSFCQAATDLTPKQVTSQTTLCSTQQGTVVTVCPGGAVGHCATTSGADDFEQYYYGISAAAGAMTCAAASGIWTPSPETTEAGATEAGTSDAGATEAGTTD